jgi:DNA replicative helicase MCM subunit Mcm2 (Cdc46/Mcm family)
MCANNSASLEVSYGHLAEMQSLLAIWLTDVPRDMLSIFDEVLKAVVLKEFPHYAKVSSRKSTLVCFSLMVADCARSACPHHPVAHLGPPA